MGTFTLDQFQHSFTESIVGTSLNHQIAGAVIPGGDLSVLDAVEVYRRGYRARLTEALGETFEAVWWVLGDDGFFRLADRYLHAYPSRSHNLSDVGEHLPAYLKETEESQEFPFLPELARFEWMFKELFHTGQHDSVPPERIQSLIATSDASVMFGAAVRLFESPYAVYSVWNRKQTAPDDRSSLVLDREQRLLLYKKNRQILVKEVDGAELQVLSSLMAGQTIAQAIGTALDRFGEISHVCIETLFPFIFHAGIMQAIHVEESPEMPA